jgi:hypothetical protein
VVSVTGNNPGAGGRMRRRFSRIATASALAMSFFGLGAANAHASADLWTTPLTLVNGWTGAPYGTNSPGVRQVDDGIVTFVGAISGGTADVAFTLPAADRPAGNVYVPVDMCNSTKGWLYIQSSGVVTVQAQGAFSDAQCFTSLEGATFALPTSGTTPLTLQNGWQGAPNGTSYPSVQIKTNRFTGGSTPGSVHFSGAIANGTSSVAFTLPVGYRPSSTAYVPVVMCGTTKGRLIISSSGTVTLQSENSFANAQCFTSLDGAWFQLNGSSPYYHPLTLQNGWSAYSWITATPAVDEDGTTVTLSGAIKTAGTNPVAFTLPSGFWPQNNVYVSVDLCNATRGRLWIQPNGVVTVQAVYGNFSNAACFTSLEGVSFTLYTKPII